MCGRVFIKSSKDIAERAGVEDGSNKPADPNNPPGGELPVITDELPTKLQSFYWGLIPHWSKSFSGPSNARIETITEKPTFKHLIGKRHCVAVVEGFYEWDQTTKQPHYIYRADKELLYMASIWDTWHDEETGLIYNSVAVITTESSGIMATIHKRMPIILTQEQVSTWLDKDLTGEIRLEGLRILPPIELSMHSVSRKVNNAKNKDFDPSMPEPPDLTLF
jgi:putative SOS response-associated peptidase YedK